jgi:hypothetical protein
MVQLQGAKAGSFSACVNVVVVYQSPAGTRCTASSAARVWSIKWSSSSWGGVTVDVSSQQVRVAIIHHPSAMRHGAWRLSSLYLLSL